MKLCSLTIEFLFKIIIILFKIFSNLNVTSIPILFKTKNIVKWMDQIWVYEVVGLVCARFVGVSGGSVEDLIACGGDGWWLKFGSCEVDEFVGLVCVRFVGVSGCFTADLVACGGDGLWLGLDLEG